MKKRASLIAATVVGTLLMGGVGQAEPPDPHPGATQPTREQNVDGAGFIKVHEQGIADTNITNEDLDVTLQNEELDVNVTNDTLPIAGDVNVTNDTLPIAGEVSVTNFPPVQDVKVINGATVPAPVGAMNQLSFEVGAGELTTENFNETFVTTLLIVNRDDEYELQGKSSMVVGTVFLAKDVSGNDDMRLLEFANPIPLNQLTVSCNNESEHCSIQVLLTGF